MLFRIAVKTSILGLLMYGLITSEAYAGETPLIEFTGTRSMAMGGAHRALGTSNETLLLNPAGMAVDKRYHADFQYGYSQIDRFNHLNASAVDSKSSVVAGGIAYTRDWLPRDQQSVELNRFVLGLAYAFGPNISLGLSGQNIRGDMPGESNPKIDIYNSTAGLLVTFLGRFGLSAVYQNMFNKQNQYELLPTQFTLGTAFKTPTLALAVDTIWGKTPFKNKPLAYHAGVEYFTMESVALRAGWQGLVLAISNHPDITSSLTGGVGFINPSSSINITGQYQIDPSTNNAWTIVTSLQAFL